MSLCFPGARWRGWRRGASACAGAVYLAGLFVADRILGGDDTAMRGRIVAEVERSFADADRATSSGRRERVADPDGGARRHQRRPAGHARALRPPGAGARASPTATSRSASTPPASQPLAWAGRPSELPSDRAQDGESWFIIEGALGLRLVYVVPVIEGTTRIGLVAAERELDVSGRGRATASLQGAPEGYHLDTSRAPVSLALPFERNGYRRSRVVRRRGARRDSGCSARA